MAWMQLKRCELPASIANIEESAYKLTDGLAPFHHSNTVAPEPQGYDSQRARHGVYMSSVMAHLHNKHLSNKALPDLDGQGLVPRL
jgi:hypothetical protein